MNIRRFSLFSLPDNFVAIITVALLITLVLPGVLAFAEAGKQTPPVTHPPLSSSYLQNLNQGMDIVLLIDESGSMAGPPGPRYAGLDHPDNSDAKNGGELRLSAAKLIIDLADENDRVAIVFFSGIILTKDETLEEVGDTEHREKMKQKIKAHFDANNASTAYSVALNEAYRILTDGSPNKQKNSSQRQQVVIFLTDGLPEESGAPQILDHQKNIVQSAIPEYEAWLWNESLEKFHSSEIPIFPLLIGSFDRQIAQYIAEKTGGITTTIDNTGGLLKSYAQVYSRLRRDLYIDYLPHNDSSFNVRAYDWQRIYQISFVFEKQKGSSDVVKKWEYTDANNRRSSKDKRTAPHYDLYYMEKNDYLNGKWHIECDSDSYLQGLIIAKSDISLNLVYPSRTSDVGAGYYAEKHPPLIGVEVKSQGRAIHDVSAPIVISPYNEELSMKNKGLSLNGKIWYVQADLGGKHKSNITLQLGKAHRPIRMRREFTVISKPFPYIVAKGVQSQGDELIFHFDIVLNGKKLMIVLWQGFVSDEDGRVTEIPVTCHEQTTDDKNNIVQPCEAVVDSTPGQTYTGRFILKGEVNGIPYSDFIEMNATTELKCSLILPSEIDLGDISFGQNEAEYQFKYYDYKDACKDVSAHITSIDDGQNRNIPPDTLSVQLRKSADGNTQILRLLGFNNLPPNGAETPYTYTVGIDFQSDSISVEPASVAARFRIPPARIEIEPAVVDFGKVTAVRRSYKATLRAMFPQAGLSDLSFDLDQIQTPADIRPEDAEKLLKWSFYPAQNSGFGNRVAYTSELLLDGVLAPGNYIMSFDVHHAAKRPLPVHPDKIELHFNVPPSKIIPPPIIMLGEFYPMPDRIPITIPITLQNVEGENVQLRFAQNQPVDEVSLMLDENKVRLKHSKGVNIETNEKKTCLAKFRSKNLICNRRLSKLTARMNQQDGWGIPITLLAPQEIKTGRHEIKFDISVVEPAYAKLIPATLKIEFVKLTLWQYIWKCYILPFYRCLHQKFVNFFTPAWKGIGKIIIFFIGVGLVYLGGRSVYRLLTGTQYRLHGYVWVGNQRRDLEGKARAYIIYNKDGHKVDVKFKEKELAKGDLIVATIEPDEKNSRQKVRIYIKGPSIRDKNVNYTVTLGTQRGLYKPSQYYQWSLDQVLHIGFAPEREDNKPSILPNPTLTYRLI